MHLLCPAFMYVKASTQHLVTHRFRERERVSEARSSYRCYRLRLFYVEMARRQAIRVYFGWPWFGIRVALPLFQICTFGLSLNQDCENSLSEKPVELLAAPFVWMVCACVCVYIYIYESIVFFCSAKIPTSCHSLDWSWFEDLGKSCQIYISLCTQQ